MDNVKYRLMKLLYLETRWLGPKVVLSSSKRRRRRKSFTSLELNWPKKVDAFAAVMYSRVEF